jgi:hypothetical protein
LEPAISGGCEQLWSDDLHESTLRLFCPSSTLPGNDYRIHAIIMFGVLTIPLWRQAVF